MFNIRSLLRGEYPAGNRLNPLVIVAVLPLALLIGGLNFMRENFSLPGETLEAAIANRYPSHRLLETYAVADDVRVIAAMDEEGILVCAQFEKKDGGLWHFEEAFRARNLQRERENTLLRTVDLYKGKSGYAVVLVRKFHFAGTEEQLGNFPQDALNSQFTEYVVSSPVGDWHYYCAEVSGMDDTYWINGW